MGEQAHAIIPETAIAATVLSRAAAAVDDGNEVVMATVVARRGSAPSTPGQKLALLSPSSAVGTVGGGAIELKVLHAMQAMAARPRSGPRLSRFQLGPQMGMCCGGSVEVMIEVIQPKVTVVLIGAGHIGSATAPLLAGLGFNVTWCDDRPEMEHLATPDSVPTAALRFLPEAHDDPAVLEGLSAPLERCALLVMTHDHQLDQQVIEWALNQGFAFVGGVGSRAKAARTRKRLEAKDFEQHDIDRFEMPLGVDIGARLPAEIAVSIAGSVIRWRHTLGTHKDGE